jgi:hypothetical protein
VVAAPRRRPAALRRRRPRRRHPPRSPPPRPRRAPQVGKDAFREGTKGTAVKLDPGQTAAADIQFVNVRNYDPGTCQPTAVKGLRIYLPQETASNFVPAEGTGCASTKIPGNQLSVKTVHVG